MLAAALLAQISFGLARPLELRTAEPLGRPPGVAAVTAAGLGDTLALAKLLNLILQAHDNQPGTPIPFARLDYARVIDWLDRILELDPRGPYPLLAASRLYGEIPDPARQRQMLDFVHRQFHAAPNQRWPALAHAAYVARHRLNDKTLALAYAHSLRLEATAASVPAWARQMEILLLADMDETAQARALLGALLDSGQVTDMAEFRFLTSRLAELERPTSGTAGAAK